MSLGRAAGWAVLTTILVVAVPRPGAAQTLPHVSYPDDPRFPLSQSETTLFDIATSGLNIGCGTDPRAQATPDLPRQQLLACVDRGTQLGRLFSAQLASYPTSAPAGGFTFSFDRTARAWIQASKSFGPSFAERPLTNGRDRLSLGFSTQHMSFNGLDGANLQGTILNGLNIRRAPNGDPLGGPSEQTFGLHGDYVYMSLTASNTVLFASYGVADRIDATLIVPTRRVTLSMQDEQSFDDCLQTTAPASAVVGSAPCILDRYFRPLQRTASGLSDISLRLKHNFLHRDSLALAYTFQISLPTGDEQDFLGTGKLGAKVQLLATATLGAVSPIVNLSYTDAPNALASRQSQDSVGYSTKNREATYTAGVDVALSSRLTAAALVLGRYFLDERSLERVEQPTGINYSAGPGSPIVYAFYRQADLPVGPRVNQIIGNAGLKWNLTRQYLIQANVLFPLTSAGLHSTITPVIGLDYTF